MSVSEKLATYADLLNLFGVDSAEAQKYLEDHVDDLEFARLAKMARRLKKALESRT